MLGHFSRTPQVMESRNRALCDMAVWPTAQKLDWRGWLNNFPEADLEYARCLLESFLYINAAATDAMFVAAFRGLSRALGQFADHPQVRVRWNQFLAEVIVVLVEGELPAVTDSGHLFARRARDLAHVPANHILSPENALDVLSSGTGRPVVFVDDFVGSGNQFIDTWNRAYGHGVSFRDAYATGRITPFYIPLVATRYGIERIHYDCAGVQVMAVHELDDRYHPLSPDSIIWREDLRATARDFLTRSCTKAGLTLSSALGFHSLGLGVAFEHGVPDATLKLFSEVTATWRPLVLY